jgi:hypothetical protein
VRVGRPGITGAQHRQQPLQLVAASPTHEREPPAQVAGGEELHQLGAHELRQELGQVAAERPQQAIALLLPAAAGRHAAPKADLAQPLRQHKVQDGAEICRHSSGAKPRP